MIRRLLIICFTTSLFCQVTLSQVEYNVGSIRGVIPDSWHEISLDKAVLDDLASITQKKDDSFQFAIPVTVDLNPSNSGCIITENNENIWVLGIRSSGAKSLNLIMEPFNLPEGAYVYIYDKGKTTIRGAFTHDNNLESNLLATMPVPGEELVLECHFPAGKDMKGAIGVGQISHDYLGIMVDSEAKDNRYGLSQSCNVDINCAAGTGYQDIKGAVCRLMINGIELCTGVMINNSNQQNIPYLLTANHCITTKEDAAKTIFIFGYESPWCSGPDGRVSHSISGAFLRATSEDIDYSLVQLSIFPPMVYKPYLAGWDVTGIVPTKSISIHHPQGDVKKIAADNDPPVSATFGTMVTNGYWQILQWDIGTTEPGSSGGPLFDQNNRVVGTLSGGDAICGRSVNDYFAKLSVSYNFLTDPVKKIKTFIDPALSGVTKLDGRDPYAANNLTNDTLTNILSGESLTVTSYISPKTGYITGFNSDSITGYAEYFQNIRSAEITEVWINLAKAKYVTTADSVTLNVYGDGVRPGQILATKRIYLKEAKDDFIMKVNFDKTIPVSGNFYIGWKLWYKAKASLETRQFAPYHSPLRFSASDNSAWFFKGGLWQPFIQHPFAPGSRALDVKVILTGNSFVNRILPTAETESDFHVYPNPAEDYIIINSDSQYRTITGDIVDISGKKVISFNLDNKFPGENKIDIRFFEPGLYNLILQHDLKNESFKILKIK